MSSFLSRSYINVLRKLMSLYCSCWFIDMLMVNVWRRLSGFISTLAGHARTMVWSCVIRTVYFSCLLVIFCATIIWSCISSWYVFFYPLPWIVHYVSPKGLITALLVLIYNRIIIRTVLLVLLIYSVLFCNLVRVY